MDELTQSELLRTWEHINLVMLLLNRIQGELSARMFAHDRSKLESPEAEIFGRYSQIRAAYGSPEYYRILEELKPALENHYRHNRHHPQYHPDGVDGMDLVDVTEMFCDWWASSLRDGGDIYRSIEIGAQRFNLSPQLVRILINSIRLLEDKNAN